VIKQTLTATSFLLGAAGAIFVAHLATHPLALTRPIEMSPVSAPASPTTPPATTTPSDGSFTLPEITIVASLERTPRSAAPTTALDPCSEWGEVGALYIEPAGAVGVHSVRRLCQAAR
jgi:hypothetical protein